MRELEPMRGKPTMVRRLLGAAASLGIKRLPPTDHRPWPLPRAPWIMMQRWENLLFAHWKVSAARMRALLPASLTLDTYEGDAWLGITPFEVTGARARGLPPLPGLSSFDEITVRTYVTVDDKPGVYFFSLDAGRALAVLGARALFGLPYHRASFGVTPVPAGEVHFTVERNESVPVEFQADYRPSGPLSMASRGSLEWWLTERYCLYTLASRGRVRRGEIHHAPWPLQPAEVSIARNTMAEPLGLELEGPPLAHFARQLDVHLWPLLPAGHALQSQSWTATMHPAT